jgi:hypothetical protein
LSARPEGLGVYRFISVSREGWALPNQNDAERHQADSCDS